MRAKERERERASEKNGEGRKGGEKWRGEGEEGKGGRSSGGAKGEILASTNLVSIRCQFPFFFTQSQSVFVAEEYRISSNRRFYFIVMLNLLLGLFNPRHFPFLKFFFFFYIYPRRCFCCYVLLFCSNLTF